MTIRTPHSLAAVLAISLIGVAQNAAAYTIDGQVSDWGVTATGNDSDWTPNSGIDYAVSDQANSTLYNNGASNNGYVVNYSYPYSLGAGGQPYDAEAIYLDYDSTNLYFAVVTGRPENVSQYPAGDVAFDFGSDGSYEFGVETRGNNGYNKGDLVAVSNWALGAVYPAGGVTEIQGGTVVSDTSDGNELVYGNNIEDIGRYTNSGVDDHYVIEGKIALADFSLYSGQDFTVHWTMGCGNDEIHVSSTLPTGGSDVPVPGTGLLLGGTLIGWTLQRRRLALRDDATDSEEDDSDNA